MNIIGGRTLEYKVVWLASTTVSNQPHAVWIDGKGDRKKLANYLGMVKCFDAMYALMRRHDDRVETSASIPISIKVETRPEIHLLAFPNTAARVISSLLGALLAGLRTSMNMNQFRNSKFPSFSILSIYLISLRFVNIQNILTILCKDEKWFFFSAVKTQRKVT